MSSAESDSDGGSALSSCFSQSIRTHSEPSVKGEEVNELSLDFLLNEQQDIKLELGSAQDHDRERTEQARKRQRWYEMTYRQRKGVRQITPCICLICAVNVLFIHCLCCLFCYQSQLRRLRREWLQLEGSLHALRVEGNLSFVNANRTDRVASFRIERLLLLLEEKQALQRDIVAFKTLEAWRRLAKARRQKVNPNVTWTMKDWVKVSTAVLEPSVLQYYTLRSRFLFSW